MAFLVAIALAVMLMMISVVNWPQEVYAEGAPDSTPAPTPSTMTGEGPASAAAPGTTRAREEDKTASVPRLGKASNPYDMEALRQFDAGSHR